MNGRNHPQEPGGNDGSHRATFMAGARDIAPVAVSTLPFALIYGALASKQGLSLPESAGMSGLVYAGASQFVALQLWAHPLPFWTVLLSVFAVNLRHLLYSAALGRRTQHWTAGQRAFGFAFLTDPTFALAELNGGPRLSLAYYLGLSLPLYANWVACSVVGALFGTVLGDATALGLDFVATAYFIHLVMSFRRRPRATEVIVASALVSLAAYVTLGSPWHIGAGALAGMALAAGLSRPAATMAAP